MIDIVMPDVGDGVTEATIVQWHANPGDRVDAGAILLEIMTDKVNMEIEAEHSGTLVEILHSADEEVRVGTVVARFDPDVQGA